MHQPHMRLDLAQLPDNAVVVQNNFQSYPHQGKLSIPNVCQNMVFVAEDLTDAGEIGRGAYGYVNRMTHRQTGHVMAVKRIRSTLDERQQRITLKDLDVVMNSANCSYIVRFYGALFREGDCWICMEMMATSLDKFYRFVYHSLKQRIPEPVIGKVTIATVMALDYLKTNLNVIHRDVKPSNILIDREGNIKLCDFGISGQLVDSIAKSRDAGCKPYMAPERINPKLCANGYDIRSDIWSLGITLMELATGQFPYPAWNSVFDQLTCVLNGDAPRLTDTSYSPELREFVDQCLNKEVRSRPKYNQIKTLAFYHKHLEEDVNVAQYFQQILDQMPPNYSPPDTVFP